MLFICYPKCSTCMKAEKFLISHNVSYQKRDIVLDTPSVEELQNFLEKCDLAVERLFNTSGMKYRELGLKDKLKDMNTLEKLELLSSDGMLIKRPILVGDHFFLNGFREKEWESVL